MKYKLITIFSLVLLVGFATAGVLSSWEKDIDLTAKQITQIKERGDLGMVCIEWDKNREKCLKEKEQNIDVLVSEIKCNEKECWAKVFQKDIINTEYRTLKNHCVKWDKLETKCLEYKDYNSEELKKMVTDYTKERLSNWADAEIERKVKRESEVKSGKGSIGVR